MHTESVALPAVKAKEVGRVAVVSWHGIAYEIIHSDIVRELNRPEDEAHELNLQKELSGRVLSVVKEVRFFPSYRHHVAISDYTADVLQSIYQIPLSNVHIIFNGADEERFQPDTAAAARFRTTQGPEC